MFLASVTTFLLATIREATDLAKTGIFIHPVLVGYQDLSLIEKQSLVKNILQKPNVIIYWIDTFEVGVSIKFDSEQLCRYIPLLTLANHQ